MEKELTEWEKYLFGLKIEILPEDMNFLKFNVQVHCVDMISVTGDENHPLGIMYECSIRLRSDNGGVYFHRNLPNQKESASIEIAQVLVNDTKKDVIEFLRKGIEEFIEDGYPKRENA